MLPLVSSQSSINSFLPCPRPQLVGGCQLDTRFIAQTSTSFWSRFLAETAIFCCQQTYGKCGFSPNNNTQHVFSWLSKSFKNLGDEDSPPKSLKTNIVPSPPAGSG